MAVFGGVVDLLDPCGSAVRAAVEMRTRLDELNRDSAIAVDNGIGLHFGEVVQGSIGCRSRKDFTVIGDAVNIAARVESLTRARGCPILLTAGVADRLPGDLRARCEDLGETKLKGRAGKVRLFGMTPVAHAPGRCCSPPGGDV